VYITYKKYRNLSKMPAFRFEDQFLQGLTIRVKYNTSDSVSAVIAECVKRVQSILDQLNLVNLDKYVKEKHFFIEGKLDEMNEDDIYTIKTMDQSYF